MEGIIKQILWFLSIIPGRFWFLGTIDTITIGIMLTLIPLMGRSFPIFMLLFMGGLAIVMFNVYTFVVPKDEWLSPFIVKMKKHRQEWLSRKPK